LKLADERNAAEIAAGGSAVHGITKFSDWSTEEFTAFLGASKPSGHASKAEKAQVVHSKQQSSAVVDWTGIYTTPVKNQGQCGSCWAFSATEQIESDTMRTLGKTYVLAPEQIVQCAANGQGCNGGWTEEAYMYVKKAGGMEQESDYPYISGTHPLQTGCTAKANENVVTVSKYYTVDGEDDMGAYVSSTGPLSVCVDANSWSSYTGGILTTCGKQVDHCVQAVGVQVGNYWKVRNSWGTDWGESGFIRLAYGKDTCAITNDPTYTAVSLV
jgi:C1A family cysteine protease